MNSTIAKLYSKAAPLLCLLFAAAFPAAVRGQYYFVTNNNTITITGYSGGGGSVTIPDTISGLPVTTIAGFAFADVGGLTAITMGTNLTTLGTNAIFQCPNLASVSFTGSMTNIGVGPFYDCQELTTITMSGTNAYILVTNDVIFNKTLTSLIQYPCGVGGTYTVPASVTNVGEAFVGNTLSAILVNSSNPDYSSTNGVLFNKNQTALINYPGAATGSYVVPGTVTAIEGSAFEYSTGVSGVSIGTNVTSIGYAAFFFSAGMQAITVNSNNAYYTSSNGVLFNKSMTQLIEYPIATGGSYIVPATVTNILDGAFGDAFYLTSVVIPNSVTYIGLQAFYACESLTNATIGNGVTNIGQEAFYYCPALTAVVIPGSVTTISEYAFGDCESLTSVCFEGKEPVDGGSIFYFDESLATILYVSGSAGWGSTYDGYTTTPCATCGGTGPQLTIARAGTNVVLTWPDTFSGYTLQSATNVVSTNWTPVAPAPVDISGSNTVTNAISGTKKYYRLSE